MNKICTNIEQSKRLIELGIDRNTADMYWDYDIQKHEDYPMVMDEQFDDTCIPAWSLSVLLTLIPKEQHPELVLNAHYKWICDISKPFSFAYKPTAGDNPFDVVFEMIVWLKENNRI